MIPRHKKQNKSGLGEIFRLGPVDFFFFIRLIFEELYLNYFKCIFPMTLHFRPLKGFFVGWLVCLSVIVSKKGRKLHIHALDRSTCFCLTSYFLHRMTDVDINTIPVVNLSSASAYRSLIGASPVVKRYVSRIERLYIWSTFIIYLWY